MGYIRTYSGLWLSSLTQDQHERTCGYWYTITEGPGTPHTAFRRVGALLRWLELVGLEKPADVPALGIWSCNRLSGSYRTEMHLHDFADFLTLKGEHSRALSNGDYVQSIVTRDPDGLRTVHTLNPNVRGRTVFDYAESDRNYA